MMQRKSSEQTELQAEAESKLLLLWLSDGAVKMLGYKVTLCFVPPTHEGYGKLPGVAGFLHQLAVLVTETT